MGMDYFGDELLSLGSKKEFEEWARSWVKGAAEDYDYQPNKTFMGSPQHKWRITSAWQKAVRRGDVATALRMVNALWDAEPKYVMYRLPVILLEDVSWGNPELLLAGMFICNHQKWMMDNSSPKKVMYMLTELAALSVKDRSTCDLVVVTDRLFQSDPTIKELFLHANVENRMEVIASESTSMEMKMAALWSLAGTNAHEGEHVMTPYRIPKPQLVDFIENFPEPAQHAWRVGSSRMKDAMPLAALLTFQQIMDSKGVTSHPDLYEPDISLGNYPASTFDWHTQEGKSSIAYFLKACAPWREWLSQFVDPDNKKAQIVATARWLFRVESGVVDQRLHYDQGDMPLEQKTLVAAAGLYGVPLDQIDVGKNLLRMNLPMLHYARCRILGLDMIAKPEVVSLKP